MTTDKAQKIAATLIRQFSRDKHFAISLPKVEDLEVLADILRDDYHCTVVWSLERHKISVYCPPSVVAVVSMDEPELEPKKAVAGKG